MLGGQQRRTLRRGTATPKRAAVFIVALSTLGGLVLSMFILRALEIRSLRRELEELRAAQQQALLDQEALRERLAEKDEPSAIEREARERLGLVMPGEEKVVFIYEEEE